MSDLKDSFNKIYNSLDIYDKKIIKEFIKNELEVQTQIGVFMFRIGFMISVFLTLATVYVILKL